jgi:serine/threonine protein kinase
VVGLSFHTCDVICSLLCQQKVYGDYEILKAIGKGKFAVVYRAKRKSDGEIGESRTSINVFYFF